MTQRPERPEGRPLLPVCPSDLTLGGSCMRRSEYERLEQSLDELAVQLAESDLSDELADVLLAEIEKTKEKLRLLPRPDHD